MDMVKLQDAVDGFIPEVRKELISDVHSAMAEVKGGAQMSADDMACLVESVADAALKASAKLLVETLGKVL